MERFGVRLLGIEARGTECQSERRVEGPGGSEDGSRGETPLKLKDFMKTK